MSKIDRETILKMPAGPKMNEQIAILVKGWAPHPSGEPEKWMNLLDYSGDIAAAMEITDHLETKGWVLNLHTCVSGVIIFGYSAAFARVDALVPIVKCDVSPTRSLAICRAALLTES